MKPVYVYNRKTLEPQFSGTPKQCAAYVGQKVAQKLPTHQLVVSPVAPANVKREDLR